MPIIPPKEFERILELAALDLDYSNLKEEFKDLTQLAAHVAGTEFALINLIDAYTQWTIANHGINVDQVPRKDSVCQYTIMEAQPLEITDLSRDDRFKGRDFVTGALHMRYYLGIPLKSKKGLNIGSLCLLDKQSRRLSPEKIQMLKIIASEIVNRLMNLQEIHVLQLNLKEAKAVKKRVTHDIRGPIGGIGGLAKLISEIDIKNNEEEVLKYSSLIQRSANTLLELVDEILNAELKAARQNPELKVHEFNLLLFKDKLEKLYGPQAQVKNIALNVFINPENEVVPFLQNKLLQITGNLISNALKFTPAQGQVSVYLDLIVDETSKTLGIKVSDSGIGLENQSIAEILNGTATSTNGTKGEQGYGLGLPLVISLINSLNGQIDIQSILGEGTTFYIKLPVQ